MSPTQDQCLMFGPMLIVRDAQNGKPFDRARVVVTRDLQHQHCSPAPLHVKQLVRNSASNIVVITNNVAPAGTRGS